MPTPTPMRVCLVCVGRSYLIRIFHLLSTPDPIIIAPNPMIPSFRTRPPMFPSWHLDILTQPPNPLSVSLPHDYTAHKYLDRPNALKRHLALARCLIQTQCRAQLVLADSLR